MLYYMNLNYSTLPLLQLGLGSNMHDSQACMRHLNHFLGNTVIAVTIHTTFNVVLKLVF